MLLSSVPAASPGTVFFGLLGILLRIDMYDFGSVNIFGTDRMKLSPCF